MPLPQNWQHNRVTEEINIYRQALSGTYLKGMKTQVINGQPSYKKPGLTQALIVAAICIAYILLSTALIGFKMDQVILCLIFIFCYFVAKLTRRFILGFSIFIIYWIIFDLMKAFPNYLFHSVHMEDLYNTEKSLFGIETNGVRLTPNEYWLQHTTTFLDVMTGFFYICWVPVPLLFATYLFFTRREQFLQFALTFFLVNIIGFIIYYTFPAAPPWYIQQHGFQFIPKTPGNTAGLARFDHYFGIQMFKGLYEKSSNVFAAMPSLHSAFPLIVFYYGVKNKLGYINILFACVAVGIWFSALYTSHHFTLDVMAGISCAILAIALLQYLVRKNKTMIKFMHMMMRVTAPTPKNPLQEVL